MRPIAMTVAVIFAGLLPIMLGGGAGEELMRRIAASMVGGMVTAPLLSMLARDPGGVPPVGALADAPMRFIES